MQQTERAPTFLLEFLTLLQSEVKNSSDKNILMSEKSAMQRTDVDSSYMTPKVGRLTVYLTVKHIVTVNGINIQETMVRYNAHFRQIAPVNAEELVRFASVRAPELIFPFIRETVAGLTASAKIGPFFLDQVDFVRICNEKMPKN